MRMYIETLAKCHSECGVGVSGKGVPHALELAIASRYHRSPSEVGPASVWLACSVPGRHVEVNQSRLSPVASCSCGISTVCWNKAPIDWPKRSRTLCSPKRESQNV